MTEPTVKETAYSVEVLIAFDALATLADTLNRLSEIAIRTEDEKLKQALRVLTNLLSNMQMAHTEALQLTRIDEQRYPDIRKTVTAIGQYCAKVRDSGYPEWQILASRAGWHPPH